MIVSQRMFFTYIQFKQMVKAQMKIIKRQFFAKPTLKLRLFATFTGFFTILNAPLLRKAFSTKKILIEIGSQMTWVNVEHEHM